MFVLKDAKVVTGDGKAKKSTEEIKPQRPNVAM